MRRPIGTIQDVAALVRGRRHELGLTQAQVATEAGVSRKWVSEVEAGKARADLTTVLRALEALGITLEAVSTPAGDPATGVHPGSGTPAAGSSPDVDLDAHLDEYLNR